MDDFGWTKHQGKSLGLDLKAMVASLPRLLADAARLAHEADASALRMLSCAELGRGMAQAASMVALNSVLAALLADGPTHDRLRAAGTPIALMAVLAAVAALLRALSTASTGQLEPKVERVATGRYLEAAHRVELSAIEGEEFQKRLDSAQYGAGAARRMLKYSTLVLNALTSLAAAAMVLTVLNPLLLPMLVSMSVPSAWATLAIARRRHTSFKAWMQHARAGQMISNLLISTSAAAEVRLYGIGPFLLRHFRTMAQTSEKEQAVLARRAARTGLIAAVWTGVAALVTFAILGALVWSGAMALAAAGTAVIAVRSGFAALNNLVQQFGSLHEEALFVSDLMAVSTDAAQLAIPTGGASLPAQPREIRFENVSFTYPGMGNEPALHDISLNIPLGKVTALVGRNGSGKSTVAKLLSGLYTTQHGRILWDGVDAAKANRYEIFSRISCVSQDFHHWPFTARVNVALGDPEAPITQDRLDEAVAYADAQEAVAEMPHGWDTLLVRGYPGGHGLSGGQWQKLGIARARYRGGQILVVDEPTAALDAEAEHRSFAKIRDLARSGQTIVLITHRLHSVRSADLIHVLDHGRLVESGTFDTLMTRTDAAREDGQRLFRRMYELQRQQFTDNSA